jgi:hypothetical protein
MKHIPDEKQVEELLENVLPPISPRLDRRLSNAPWTRRAVARRRLINSSLAAALLVALLVAVTPQGRAFAQSILRFFVRSESDTLPVPTSEPMNWVGLTPGVPLPTKTPLPSMAIFADECGDFGNPTCTVEQIRSKVDFTVKEPANIPEGLYFIGATGGPDNIYLLYYYENQSGSLSVTLERWAGAPSPQTSLIGASAAVEKVQIGNRTGEYFKGIFVYEDGANSATWDPDFGAETLRWLDDGISYTLNYASASAALEKEGLVALAESMTTEPVAKLPMPVPTEDPYTWEPGDAYNLSVSEAEQQAGFKVSQPATLPDVLSLVGASYDATHGYVQIFYQTPQGEGLTLRQEVASTAEYCTLCDILVGDYNTVEEGNPDNIMVVPFDANLETVQIGAVSGKYIEGVWSGTDCCGWVWDPNPYLKTLRWWADGRAFELTYMGMEIEKADMLRIAESLK